MARKRLLRNLSVLHGTVLLLRRSRPCLLSLFERCRSDQPFNFCSLFLPSTCWTQTECSLYIQTVIIGYCNSKALIGLAAKVCEPLYHGREKATIKLSSGSCSCKAKAARYSNVSSLFFIKTIIPLALVGYEMIIIISFFFYNGNSLWYKKANILL